jgi:hypothetical protein
MQLKKLRNSKLAHLKKNARGNIDLETQITSTKHIKGGTNN